MNCYKDFNITIGSDPEFMLACVGEKIEMLQANRALTNLYSDEYGSGQYVIIDETVEKLKGIVIIYLYSKDLFAHLDILGEINVANALIEIFKSPYEFKINITALESLVDKYSVNGSYYTDINDEYIDYFPYGKMGSVRVALIETFQDFKSGNPKESTKEAMSQLYIAVHDKPTHSVAYFYSLLDTYFNKNFVLQTYESDKIFWMPEQLHEFILSDDKFISIIDELVYKERELTEQELSMAQEDLISALVGCDGNTVVGELRPHHSSNPINHFYEIRELIHELYEISEKKDICDGKKLGMFSGGYQFGNRLGGHIHIGYNVIDLFGLDNIQPFTTNTESHINFVDLVISNVLSYYLSIFVGVPLICISDNDTYELRHVRSYYENDDFGQFGSGRMKEYGFEWRMPSSWLVTPDLCLMVLTTSYVVAYEAINRTVNMYKNRKSEAILFHDEIVTSKYDAQTINEMIINIDRAEYFIQSERIDDLKAYINSIYEQIQEMILYKDNPNYKEIVDTFFYKVKKNEIIDKNQSVFETWEQTFIYENNG